MNALATLLHERPVIFVHVLGAIAALGLGIFILARRKGTASHRALGWVWVLAMGTAAVSSAFIPGTGALPSLFGFSPIHVFTVTVSAGLPIAVWHARRGNLVAHRQWMRGMFVGGCVIAGLFTLMPGRFLGGLLWQQLPL
jgi:uncharacterized membrane protein